MATAAAAGRTVCSSSRGVTGASAGSVETGGRCELKSNHASQQSRANEYRSSLTSMLLVVAANRSCRCCSKLGRVVERHRNEKRPRQSRCCRPGLQLPRRLLGIFHASPAVDAAAAPPKGFAPAVPGESTQPSRSVCGGGVAAAALLPVASGRQREAHDRWGRCVVLLAAPALHDEAAWAGGAAATEFICCVTVRVSWNVCRARSERECGNQVLVSGSSAPLQHHARRTPLPPHAAPVPHLAAASATRRHYQLLEEARCRTLAGSKRASRGCESLLPPAPRPPGP